MDLEDRIADALGARPARLAPLSGGDVATVVAGETAAGLAFVAKTGAARLEAEMLGAIAATGCPVPEVIHAGDDLLIMSRLAQRGAREDGWRAAAAAIARMHATHGARFGWRAGTAFGPVLCPAPPTDDWANFWAEARLMAWPDALPADIARRVETLAGRLDSLLDHDPVPSLLHGDMWAGNVLFDGTRFSGLIDPACYHGDAEVDLAMLTLFGTPPAAFREAYGSLDEGWERRRPLYQLWPALVHLRLFGGTYRAMVEARLDALGA